MDNLLVNLENLKQEYLEGYSCSQLAKKYNKCVETITKYLRKMGVTIINHQNETKFNENIFDQINTEEKAYWLGFIYADGFVSSTRNTFEISLKGSDVEHLNKFNKFTQHIKNNVKIGQSKCGGKIFQRCRWSVVNKHLKQQLIKLGCVPNKSLVLKFPNLDIFSDKSLIYPFIRGYFDGDGSVFETKNSFHISISGNNDFLQGLNSIISARSITKDQRSNVYLYVISKQKDVLNFLNLIYKGANIYLDRKYLKYIDICRAFLE